MSVFFNKCVKYYLMSDGEMKAEGLFTPDLAPISFHDWAEFYIFSYWLRTCSAIDWYRMWYRKSGLYYMFNQAWHSFITIPKLLRHMIKCIGNEFYLQILSYKYLNSMDVPRPYHLLNTYLFILETCGFSRYGSYYTRTYFVSTDCW